MEHLQHFGLAQDPFQNEPDLRFYFDSGSHRAVQCRLERALRQNKGLSVLSGEGGTGKTLLARRIFEGLEEELFEAQLMVMLPGAADASAVLKRYARQLGVDDPAEERSQLLAQIYEQVAIVREDGRHAVLILDDAHVLSREAMSEVGGLLNLEYEDRRLVSLLLVGLSELDEALTHGSLSRRVDVRAPLQPLDLENTAAYLSHRIREVGGNPIIVPDEAVHALYKMAGGRPRMLNTLADNALFEAYLGGRQQIHPGDVERAAADLGVEASTPAEPAREHVARAPQQATRPTVPAAQRPLTPNPIAPKATAASRAPAIPQPTAPTRPRVDPASLGAAPRAPRPLPVEAPRTPVAAQQPPPAIEYLNAEPEFVQPEAQRPVPAPAPEPMQMPPQRPLPPQRPTLPAPAPNPPMARPIAPQPPLAAAPVEDTLMGEITDPGIAPALETRAPMGGEVDLGELLDTPAAQREEISSLFGDDPTSSPATLDLDVELDAPLQPDDGFAGSEPTDLLPIFEGRNEYPNAGGGAEATRIAFPDEDPVAATTGDEIDDLFVELVDD